jgi:hypothetical protein
MARLYQLALDGELEAGQASRMVYILREIRCATRSAVAGIILLGYANRSVARLGFQPSLPRFTAGCSHACRSSISAIA